MTAPLPAPAAGGLLVDCILSMPRIAKSNRNYDDLLLAVTDIR
jgi:hypothetical protein